MRVTLLADVGIGRHAGNTMAHYLVRDENTATILHYRRALLPRHHSVGEATELQALLTSEKTVSQ